MNEQRGGLPSPHIPQDPEDADMEAEIAEYFADPDTMLSFIDSVVDEFAREHNPAYQAAFRRDGDPGQVNRDTVAGLQGEYGQAFEYIARLATGQSPDELNPQEEQVRDAFGILTQAPRIFGNSYGEDEIHTQVRDRMVGAAALAHAGGREGLAQGYINPGLNQAFMDRHGFIPPAGNRA